MKTYSVVYESVLTFHLLPTDEINCAKSILVQIYSTYRSRSMLEKIAREVQIFFPDAVIVGVTTFGDIHNNAFSEHKTIIAITTFDKTKVTGFSLGEIEEEQTTDAGKLLAKKVLKRDTKLLLLFCDTLQINPEELLEGVSSVAKNVPICGGLAADYGKFFETILIHNDQTITKGAVAIGLSGSHLTVAMEAVVDLRAVGPDLEITSARKNRVYEINGRIAAEMYAHYLGRDFVDKFPLSGLEIALVTEKEGLQIARNVTSLYEDGSIRYTGNIDPGCRWKFGYIDKKSSSTFCFPKFSEKGDFETFFLFSDASQQLLNKERLYNGLDTLSKTATTVGYFGYGQFFYKEGKSYLLNQSMVVLGLSETKQKAGSVEKECRRFPLDAPEEVNLLSDTLSHLSRVMFEELELRVGALGLLMEEFPHGVLLYDRNLLMESCNTKASTLLGLDVKLASGRDLERMEQWIVSLLQEGLNEKFHSKVGSVIDPVSGKNITVRIDTIPVTHQGITRGAIAIIQEVEPE